MASYPSHDRTHRPSDDDDEEDPVDKMINKTGCADLHYAVQECMADKQDWRKCQDAVVKFKKCIDDYMKSKMNKT